MRIATRPRSSLRFNFSKRKEAMRIALSLLVIGLAGCSGRASPAFNGDVALELVEAQVGFGPRYPGSQGHAEVQEWIAEELGKRGWTVETMSFPYRGTTLTNLSGILPGSGGDKILLGAHYDTRRIADRGPEGERLPVPGANDGGSGVAVLLEIARVLPDRNPGCDVGLVFFDGEDNGNLDGWDWAVGSRAFAAALEVEPRAVVVVDMVGDRDLRLPIERSSTPDLAAEIWAAAQEAGSKAFVMDVGHSILDDHVPFLERGWRAVDIIDIDYPYWHTTADTPDKVAAESLAQVGDALLTWLDLVCPPGVQ